MTAQRIFLALQDVDGVGRASQDAAKAGFLEWAMTLPCARNAASAAKDALLHIEAMHTDTSAARQFLDHLRCASCALPTPIRRGGAKARRRVLH